MEINKTMCKPLAEVFSGELDTREDMYLAKTLVNRALSTPVCEGEVEDYTLESVLPADVQAMPAVVAVVQACLDKIKAENELNAIEKTVQEAMRAARAAAKPQLVAKLNDRDLAVWNLKRALYVDGDKLPETPPKD